MALDEVSVTCPIDLPAMLSDSAGKGILIEWVAHSMSQLESRWGKDGAQTIIACSGVLRLLGGIKNSETLRLASELCGETEGPEGKPVPVVPVELLRVLPDWRALVIRTNLYPVVVKFRPYWRRIGYRWPFRLRQAIPAPLPVAPSRYPAYPLLEDTEETDVVLSGGVMLSTFATMALPDESAPTSQNGHKPQSWIPEAR